MRVLRLVNFVNTLQKKIKNKKSKKFLASVPPSPPPLRFPSSQDASNKFGESVVHVACRRGGMDVIRFLLANGGSRTCCDDLGRFPLHEVCWAAQPRFDIVRLFLDDPSNCKANADDDTACLLLVTDKRGCTPLRYVREESWSQWCRFLDEVVDHYWPSVN